MKTPKELREWISTQQQWRKHRAAMENERQRDLAWALNNQQRMREERERRENDALWERKQPTLWRRLLESLRIC